MSKQNQKHKGNSEEKNINRRIKSYANKILIEEVRNRIESTNFYNTEKSLNEFIKYAIKFDDPVRALSLLHNCHVIRINRGFPSNTTQIVKSLRSVITASDPIILLEKAIEQLSDQNNYKLDRMELIDKLKMSLEKRKKIKSKLKHEIDGIISDKNKKKKIDEIDEIHEKLETNEDIDGPSEKELKRIEKEFKEELKNDNLLDENTDNRE